MESTRLVSITKRSLPATALVVSIALISGCGGDGLKLVPVSGIVTLNGEPLPGATIVFTPAQGTTQGTTGMDKTGPEGNFRIMTRGRTGLPPGKYSVLVTKEVDPNASNSTNFTMIGPDGTTMEDSFMQEIMREYEEGQDAPPKASAVKVSETFDREISSDGEILDFDVKAAAKDAGVLRAAD